MRALCWRIKGSVGDRRDLVACRRKGSGAAATTRVRFVAFEFAETLPRPAPCFPNPISHEKELIEFGDLEILRF
jgi:hypothetical protein